MVRTGWLAPHRTTDAQELRAEPLNHSGRIGNFFFKLYRGHRTLALHTPGSRNELVVCVEIGANVPRRRVARPSGIRRSEA